MPWCMHRWEGERGEAAGHVRKSRGFFSEITRERYSYHTNQATVEHLIFFIFSDQKVSIGGVTGNFPWEITGTVRLLWKESLLLPLPLLLLKPVEMQLRLFLLPGITLLLMYQC